MSDNVTNKGYKSGGKKMFVSSSGFMKTPKKWVPVELINKKSNKIIVKFLIGDLPFYREFIKNENGVFENKMWNCTLHTEGQYKKAVK